MKYRILTLIAALALFVALAVPVRLAAQGQQQTLPNYTVIDLGTLGGASSQGGGVNNSGLVEGSSQLSGGTITRAVVWHDGVMTDLGTLGGPNSWAGWQPSANGEVGGHSDISKPDPNGEDWCGFGTSLICRPFLWKDGVMTALPTLGGNNGAALSVNNQGQVVGYAEFNTLEPGCDPAYPHFFTGAVVWKNGKIQQSLPTVLGDTDAYANSINDRGQVTGYSTINCASSGNHGVLWQDGKAINLGGLGGTSTYGLGINNQGQVVGLSNVTGDATGHAFLWQHGVTTDLGTLPGDFFSGGQAINNRGQVVGSSVEFSPVFNVRAYLWQNGVMTDLNTLIPADSPLYLAGAYGINDEGQISGYAVQISTGETHAFLATPTTQHWPIHGCPKVVFPDDVRNQLQQKLRSDRRH